MPARAAPTSTAPTSTAEAADVLRDAAARGLAVWIRGAGTKHDWGRPPRRVDLIVDTRALAGVVEHAAGDLIAIVRAGTPLTTLGAALAPAGQQLALDVPLPDATVGGTVAVNTSGPRRLLYGTARDLLIGITVVRADGTVARSGGKVVKNVAGYDLGKLYTGSYGTLGLITECAFRLHPLPAATAVVCGTVDTAQEVGALAARVRAAQVVPSGVEVDAPPGQGYRLGVLVEGVPRGVDARVAVLRSVLGDGATVGPAPPWWGGYPWRPGDVGLKLTGALSQVPALLSACATVGLAVRGSVGAGVLYAGLPAESDPETVARAVDTVRATAHAAGGHAVVLTAPAPMHDRLDLWGPVPGLSLMRRVKAQFDPDGRLAPGHFLDGLDPDGLDPEEGRNVR